MENSGHKRNPLSLQLPIYRNPASISSDHKHLRFSGRRFHFHAAEFCIIASTGDAIKLPNIIGSKDFLRCTIFLNVISMNTDHLVRNLLGKIQLMKGHDHRHLFFQYHLLQNGKKLQLMPDIQEGGRFIQDNDLRFLADGACQKDTLSLSVTDGCKIPILQIPGVNHLHGTFNFFLVLCGKDPESSGIGISSGGYHILTGHKLRSHALGKYYSQFF